MKKICALLLGVGVLSGCATNRFILVEQTPQSPTFTVIPFDADSDFTRDVERELLALKLTVIERPELKFIATDAVKTESETTGVSVQTSRITASGIGKEEGIKAPYYKVDVVAMYPNSKADYIVVTYSESKEIRILRRSDLVLVASGRSPAQTRESVQDFVETVLVSANLAVSKENQKECKVVSKKSRWSRFAR